MPACWQPGDGALSPRAGRGPTPRSALAVLALGVVATGLAGCAGAGGYTDAEVARGRYLTRGLCECFGCHSPLQEGGLEIPVESELGAGDILDEEARQVAPNLTPDRETGAGLWTDEQLIRAIREGIGHDGRRLGLVMPYDYYSVMTDDDARAVVAYLRSLAPVRHPLPKWVPLDAAERPSEPLRRPARPSEISALRDRGGYLVRLGRCGHCHTPRPASGSKRLHRADLEFGGGRRYSTANYFEELDPDPSYAAPPSAAGPAEIVVSPNITSDPSGIAYYDEQVFIQTIRTGKVAGVRPLTWAMPWNVFRNLTDDDLRAIFLYLRTVPPVRHRVSNSDPPTWCPRCGRLHGLGELNEP